MSRLTSPCSQTTGAGVPSQVHPFGEGRSRLSGRPCGAQHARWRGGGSPSETWVPAEKRAGCGPACPVGWEGCKVPIPIRHTAVRTICFQVQLNRTPAIDVVTVSRLMLRLALSPEIREFSIQHDPKHLWVNFLFSSQAVGRSWRMLHSRALTHRRWGPRLRRSAIVTCEGSRGWDNYLLLHHFDTRQVLDKLAGV